MFTVDVKQQYNNNNKIASREILPMTVTKMRLKAEFVSNADENEAEGRDQLIEFLAFQVQP